MQQHGRLRRNLTALAVWLAALVASSALVAFTGGLRSPFLPLLVLPAVLGVNAGITKVPLLVVPEAAALAALWWGRSQPGAGAPWRPVEDAVLLFAALGIAWVVARRLRHQLDVAEAEAHQTAAALVEAEADRAREQELLASGVAHELKNPLTAVRSLVSHLAGAPGASPQLVGLADAVRELSAQVDHLLAVTRPSRTGTGSEVPAEAPHSAAQLLAFFALARRVVLAFGVVLPLLLWIVGMETWRLVVALALAAALAVWELLPRRTTRTMTQTLAPLLLFAAVHYLLNGAAEGPLRSAIVVPACLVALVAPRDSVAVAFVAGAGGVVALGLALHLTVNHTLAVPPVLDLARPEVLFGPGAVVHFALTAWPMVATAVVFREGRRWLASAEGRRADALLRTARLERERWEALERFLSSVVHGLSPQLDAVTAAARAERDAATLKSRERMDVVLRELERMQRLLADVHCIARAPDRLEPVDVGALVDRLLPAWQVAAAGRGVEVTADAPRGLTLSGETLRIEVIATNLVKNAVEASRPGGRVRVTAGAGALIVEDEGEGLAPSLAGTLFTAGATTKPSGSGLGLFMSRRLASQLGGDLELENRAPRGCRATLTLTTPYPPQPRADA